MVGVRVAVVGHSEWVTFAQVKALPASGDIIHAHTFWDEPAGGGSVASAQLAALNGSCAFFTAVGNDAIGKEWVRALANRSVIVHAAIRADQPHPRAFTFLESVTNERTITVLGPGLRPRGADALPWEQLAQMDAVYFASGDVGALTRARAAKVLVTTARVMPLLQQAHVPIDVLVHSASDAGETYEPGMLSPAPKWVVTTEGERGGRYTSDTGSTGRYEAAPLPGPRQDAYGAGDSFAAGLTYALACGRPLAEALLQGARCGASANCRRGALGESY